MKLFVPTIGTQLKLLANWTFTLYHESRNDTLWTALVGPLPKNRWGDDRYLDKDWSQGYKSEIVTLPAGTHLTVDRVYIRQGSDKTKSFDSLSFRVKKANQRFWAKLSDVNTMDVEIVTGEEDPIVRGYAYINPNANIPTSAVLKIIAAENVNIVKSYSLGSELERWVIIEAPSKRMKSVMGQPLKYTKERGWEWQPRKTRYREKLLEKAAIEYVTLMEPTDRPVTAMLGNDKVVKVKVGQPICLAYAGEHQPFSYPKWEFRRTPKLAYIDSDADIDHISQSTDLTTFICVAKEPGKHKVKAKLTQSSQKQRGSQSFEIEIEAT